MTLEIFSGMGKEYFKGNLSPLKNSLKNLIEKFVKERDEDRYTIAIEQGTLKNKNEYNVCLNLNDFTFTNPIYCFHVKTNEDDLTLKNFRLIDPLYLLDKKGIFFLKWYKSFFEKIDKEVLESFRISKDPVENLSKIYKDHKKENTKDLLMSFSKAEKELNREELKRLKKTIIKLIEYVFDTEDIYVSRKNFFDNLLLKVVEGDDYYTVSLKIKVESAINPCTLSLKTEFREEKLYPIMSQVFFGD